MAFSCHVGSINIPASTGNQAITGVGFQPKAIIFIGSETDTDESKANALVGLGFAVSSSLRSAMGLSCIDNVGTTTVNRYHSNSLCVLSSTGSLRYAADLVSMDSDGFTLNWSSVQSGEEVIFLALGGSDLTNATILNFTSPTATGNQAKTGVGFQPDCVLLFGALTISSELDSALGNVHFGMGAAISSTERGALGGYSGNNLDTSDSNVKQASDECFTVLNGTSVFEECDLVSMDSDGFTLNWSSAHSSERFLSALCLKGGQYKIGVETQKTSTGTKATTGVGFQPSGLFVFGANKTSSASVQAGLNLSLGAASSTTARGCHWIGDSDNVGTSVSDSDHDTASVIKHLTEGTPTLDAEADLSSFDSDGFTLDWTTADATAREFVYVAFGSDASGGSVSSLIGGKLAKGGILLKGLVR